jgi:hypothetical protein
MAQEIINVGAAPNDGQGDPIREAFTKCNDNFTELFSGLGGSNAISNGNSVVQISTANGNISMSVSGTANVAVVTPTGITVSNTVSAANIDAVNLVINNISSDDSTFITIEDGVIVNGVISAAGNVTGGNIFTAGLVSATGNIAGNFILGNGSQLTGITTNYSNANVAAFLPTYSGNITANAISATGNVAGAFFIGDGSQLTNLPAGDYSNANVAAYLPTYSGNITAGNVSATGNITGGNLLTTGTISTTGNVVSGNVVTTTGTFRLPSFTTLELANITPTPGDMVYNTTENNVQAWQYNATNVFAWVSLAVSTYQ